MKNIQIPSALSPTHDFHNELPTRVFIVLKCQFSKNISKVVWDTSQCPDVLFIEITNKIKCNCIDNLSPKIVT